MGNQELNELRETAAAVFGFDPGWSDRIFRSMARRCAELEIKPVVLLRTFATATRLTRKEWGDGGAVLAKKWEQFIPETLQLMKDEARVKFENDAVEFRSSLELTQDYRETLDNPVVNITAIARVHHARAFGLDDIADKWEAKARKASLFNPFLADMYRA